MDLRSPRSRIFLVACFASLWMGAALVRLAYLQLFCYSDFLSRAEHQQRLVVEVSPRRADILDRNDKPLAMSVPVDTCFAVPSEIADPDMVSHLLSGILGESADDILARLDSSRTYARIARKLSPDTVERIEDLNLKGIYFEKEDARFYPKRELAASVLGYVDTDQKGLGGIEYSLDDRIRSEGGRRYILADAHRKALDSSDRTPQDGQSVVLTLDQNIQHIAETELNAAIAQTHAISGTVIVEDPSNGELLAVANSPSFNPNAAGSSPVEARMDRAISALYEPGSVFKIVTLSAAIDQGITHPEEVVDCQNGAIYIAGHRIRDHKAYGDLTVAQILAYSSDVGAIKIGLRLGAPKLYDYINAYGFGQATGVDLPGESKGMLRRLENWTPISVGSISMGQEIGVTPIQILSAMSAIANGGLIVRPHVVKELRRGDSDMTPEQPAPRRVIRATTAATMRQMLEGVVLSGTGTKARLDGYTAAGKTGTAQKFDPATGRYSSSQLIASFVGFAPLNTPAIAVLVQLDSPVGPHEGGEVAAPVFQRVAQQVLEYLNVPHDVATAPKLQLASRRRGQQDPTPDVSDFDPAQTDDSAAPTDAPAPAPQTASAPSAAPQTVELDESQGVAVPNLAGQTVRTVTEQCERLGFIPVLVGSGVALKQSPPPGTKVRPGTRVTVQFGRAAPAPPTPQKTSTPRAAQLAVQDSPGERTSR
jgi:cell division protein FtsI (penicillin-binding protein 3)